MIISSDLIEQANMADMISFLERRYGFSFLHKGGGYRCREHPSLAVKDDRLSWFWHSKGVGGFGVPSFLVKVEGLHFHDAVKIALEDFSPAPLGPVQPIMSEQPKELVLPPKCDCLQSRLLDYLCNKRGIDSGIVTILMEEGKIYEDMRGNVVFVGHDESGQPRFACLRGTRNGSGFRQDCSGSDKRYAFKLAYAEADSARLYAFESAIDALSHASLDNNLHSDGQAWRRHNRIALAGTADTALPIFLEQHPQVKQIILCLDNDDAGRTAAVAIARKYSKLGYDMRIELPRGAKDYNDLLLAYRQQQVIQSRRKRFAQQQER